MTISSQPDKKVIDTSSILLLRKMSHGMRSPLNALIATSDMFSQGVYGEMNPKQTRAVERMQRNSRRLLALLDDVMTYIRADAGELPYTLETFAPVELLAEAVEQVQNAIEDQMITIHLDNSRSVPSALIGDAAHIRRIFLALLWNAVAVTESDRAIFVETDWEDAQWTVCVHDSGLGIRTENQALIFEPFWTDGSGNRIGPSSGYGLGLSVARALAELMQGELILKESSATGSTFCLRLPLASPDSSV